jgi:hypothetical protein
MSIGAEPGSVSRPSFRNVSGGEEIAVTDEVEAARAVRETLEHRRKGNGKLIGLAGMSRHGKTEFAKQVRDRRKFGPDEIRQYAAGKTHGGFVNLYRLPGEELFRRDVLIDLAGEDFHEFGRYASDVPLVMQRVLWPVLPHLDGLVVFIALPYLWDAWNQVERQGALRPPTAAELRSTEEATADMLNSTMLLLKYALVARQVKRLSRNHPGLVRPSGHAGPWAPERHAVDEAFKSLEPMELPVFVAFSKSDLCCTPSRRGGLRTPPLPVNGTQQYHARVRPEATDPLVLAMQAFPRLYEFLSKHVRYFKFDFIHVIRDTTPNPNASEAPGIGEGGEPELKGVESALEFLGDHGWGFAAGGTVKAIDWSRRRDPDRWRRENLRAALGETSDAQPLYIYQGPPEEPPSGETAARRDPPAPAPGRGGGALPFADLPPGNDPRLPPEQAESDFPFNDPDFTTDGNSPF